MKKDIVGPLQSFGVTNHNGCKYDLNANDVLNYIQLLNRLNNKYIRETLKHNPWRGEMYHSN